MPRRVQDIGAIPPPLALAISCEEFEIERL